jgi:hypothetical protein
MLEIYDSLNCYPASGSGGKLLVLITFRIAGSCAGYERGKISPHLSSSRDTEGG